MSLSSSFPTGDSWPEKRVAVESCAQIDVRRPCVPVLWVRTLPKFVQRRELYNRVVSEMDVMLSGSFSSSGANTCHGLTLNRTGAPTRGRR